MIQFPSRWFNLLIACCCLPLGGLTGLAIAERPLKADERSLSFGRDVHPIFSKLGCAALRCHGSFQGQGGFRLSLFGRHPREDFESLSERIDTDDPQASLLILKPAGRIDHEGGTLLNTNDSEYESLIAWIRSGGSFDRVRAVQLRLENRRVVLQPGTSEQLVIWATWEDGTQTEVSSQVTYLCQGNGVKISPNGLATAQTEAALVPFVAYLGTCSVQGLIVVGQAADAHELRSGLPTSDGYVSVDRFVDLRLAQMGIQASERCSDDTFLRRVTLDLVGRLPTADEAATFRASSSATKRAEVIRSLMEHVDYGERWGSWLSGLMGCDAAADEHIENSAASMSLAKSQFVAASNRWYASRVLRDMPITEIVASVLSATTREGMSLSETMRWEWEFRTRAWLRQDTAEFYADRETNDLFWRVQATDVDERAELLAKALYGADLQCARCHDHPRDLWTQEQHQGFTAIFGKVALREAPDLSSDDRAVVLKFGVLAIILWILTFVIAPGVLWWFGRGVGVPLFFLSHIAALSGCVYIAIGYLKEFEIWSAIPMSPGWTLVHQLQHAGVQPWPLRMVLISLAGTILAGTIMIYWRGRRLKLCRPRTAMMYEMLAMSVLVFGSFTVADSFFIAGPEGAGETLWQAVRGRWMSFQEVYLSDSATNATAAREVVGPADQSSVERVPRLLDGTEIMPGAEDRRIQLAISLGQPAQIQFARNIVNRLWMEYFGRGLIPDTDQLSPLRAATHPDLLEWLAMDFHNHGFSMKHLHERLLTSRVYQRTSIAQPNQPDIAESFSRYRPKRLSEPQLINAISAVTHARFDFGPEHVEPSVSAYRYLGWLPRSGSPGSLAKRVFGRGRLGRGELGVDGAMFLMTQLEEMIQPTALRSPESSKLVVVRRIRELYQTSLNRAPTDQESKSILDFLDSSSDSAQAWSDVLWAVLNSEEFQLNH